MKCGKKKRSEETRMKKYKEKVQKEILSDRVGESVDREEKL